MADVLLELFSEEIPARMQAQGALDLQAGITAAFTEAGLKFGAVRRFYGPRRLTLAVAEVAETSQATDEERRGPRTDAPVAAIEGFVRSVGLPLEQLDILKTDKGRFYGARLHRPGRPAAEVIAEAVARVIEQFPWPKSMRHGSGNLHWVRPLHGILCLLTRADGSSETVPVAVEGLQAGNHTRGHRFMAPEPFEVTGIDDYLAKLRAAYVIVDPQERRTMILEQAQALCNERGLIFIEDEALLAENVGLSSYPQVLMGDIAPEFRDLPPEILQTSMRLHQKFFTARDVSGTGAAFLAVAGLAASDGGAAILQGNRRVLAARLADARYFWDLDLKRTPGDFLRALEQVTYHAALGTVAERSRRVAAAARQIASVLGLDTAAPERAALLAKYDLVSETVGEFPELQGTIGRYHAARHGELPAVCAAIEAHYRPQGPSDRLPDDAVGAVTALADKIDRLAGFFVINELPTGSKDPFALRRAALGIIRIAIEGGVSPGLQPLLRSALRRNMLWAAISDDSALCELAKPLAESTVLADRPVTDIIEELSGIGLSVDPARFDDIDALSDRLHGFILDRLRVYLRDRGFRHDLIAAALAIPDHDLQRLYARVRALTDFYQADPDADAPVRRALGMLRAEEKKDGRTYDALPDAEQLDSGTESALYVAVSVASANIAEATARGDFAAALEQVAALRGPADAFFNAVTVNDPDPAVRRRRLALLHAVRAAIDDIADFLLPE